LLLGLASTEGLGVAVCPERTLDEKGVIATALGALSKMGEGPPMSALQARASNHHELLGSRALVVSVDGKRHGLTVSGEIRGVERE
jgi:hypothetical protein